MLQSQSQQRQRDRGIQAIHEATVAVMAMNYYSTPACKERALVAFFLVTRATGMQEWMLRQLTKIF